MAVAFFIVAHSDDWFLFMGNAGLDAVADRNNTIVFVYVTAANFLDGSANTDTFLVRAQTALGLRARETATIATAQSIFPKKQEFTPYFPAVGVPGITADGKQIGNRTIPFYELENTKHYCLRLPDGNVDGSGAAWAGRQSLRKLKNGEMSINAQGEYPEVYDDWQDLVDTMRGILDLESGGADCWLNYLDTQDANQDFPKGHSDHYHVGLLVEAAGAAANYNHAQFRGYTDFMQPVNLTPHQVAAKTSLIHMWDDTQHAFSGGVYARIWDTAVYHEWALRQYLMST